MNVCQRISLALYNCCTTLFMVVANGQRLAAESWTNPKTACEPSMTRMHDLHDLHDLHDILYEWHDCITNCFLHETYLLDLI